MTTDQRDVVALLLEDHAEAKSLLAKVEASQGSEREEAFRDLVYELVRHETVEEELVYPQVRQLLVDGDAVADARTKEEAAATRMLADLEKLDVDSQDFDRKFTQLRDDVLAHANAEEREVFPRLSVMKDPDRLQAMARLLELVKKTAPTHPHPHIPPTATANLTLGPVAAIVDRTRDAIRDLVKS